MIRARPKLRTDTAPYGSERPPASLGLACLLVVLFLATLAAPVASEKSNELDETLVRLDRIAALYKDRALSFTCEERVEHNGAGAYHYRYVFVYNDEGQLVDHRLGRRGKRVIDADKNKAVLLNAYMWIFLFQKDRWPHYRFELEGETSLFGRWAKVLRFEAQEPIKADINDWSGRIWVDAESFQPLRVEAFSPGDDVKNEDMLSALKSAREEGRSHRSTHAFRRITTDFEMTKNGMRFPSVVHIATERNRVIGGRKRASIKQEFTSYIVQEYSDYQFYEVKTEQEIEAFVREGVDKQSR